MGVSVSVSEWRNIYINISDGVKAKTVRVMMNKKTMMRWGKRLENSNNNNNNNMQMVEIIR
jgi:hypothetical protein